MTHHLIGLIEVAELLSVSRQRADQITQSLGFPAPQADLANGRIWLREEVERWARTDGRAIRSMTNREELDELSMKGTKPAPGAFRSTYVMARRAALATENTEARLSRRGELRLRWRSLRRNRSTPHLPLKLPRDGSTSRE